MPMYKVDYSDTAKEQLDQLVMYIVQDSGDVDAALRLNDRIEEAIKKLAKHPYMGSFPVFTTLKQQGFRYLVIERYLAFYTVDEEEKTVTIAAIVDSRREYQNLL